MVMESPAYSPCPVINHSSSEIGMLPYFSPPLINTFQEMCPLPMPSRGVYTCPYMPHLMGPEPAITQTKVNLGAIFIHPMTVPSPKDLKEQKRKNLEFLMQSRSLETQ